VVGEAAGRADALAIVASERPDVVLLDLVLGEDRGEEMIPEIRRLAPRCAVLVLTALSQPDSQRAAVLRGARGVVAKEAAAEVLVKAIQKVHAGEIWLERAQLEKLLTDVVDGTQGRDEEGQRIATLTAREREVIRLVGQGLRNEEIAKRLALREKTVRNHLTSVYDKLGVHDRLELAIYAHRRRLASLDEDRTI
jgi:DNA-binding NarL/FixJ family response regulator